MLLLFIVQSIQAYFSLVAAQKNASALPLYPSVLGYFSVHIHGIRISILCMLCARQATWERADPLNLRCI
jgi:hypothetical protein